MNSSRRERNRFPAVVAAAGSNWGGTHTINLRDCTTGIIGVAEGLGVGEAAAAPGISVAEMEGKIPARFGKLQDETPNTSKPITTKLGINLKKVLYLL